MKLTTQERLCCTLNYTCVIYLNSKTIFHFPYVQSNSQVYRMHLNPVVESTEYTVLTQGIHLQ